MSEYVGMTEIERRAAAGDDQALEALAAAHADEGPFGYLPPPNLMNPPVGSAGLCLADVAAYGACTLPKGHAESWHKDAFGRTFQLPGDREREPAARPAALAWTPERATRRAILRTYGGRLLLCDADHFALRFPNMAAAVVWAEATDMVDRVKVITPQSELPISSAIMLRLRLTP